jgi:hypothetical protein
MSLLDSPGLNKTPTSLETNTPNPELQPYINNVLQKGNALLNAGTPAYTGQMTAGPSELQTQSWKGLSNLTLPSTLTQSGQNLLDIQGKAQNMKFDPSQVSQYMNPFLQNALNPQLEEARRQSQITQLGNQAKYAAQGAFGGGRSAIMEAEGQRNLERNLANITGTGYKSAYDDAMKAAQYNSDLGLRGLQQATTANQAAGNVGAQEASYGLQNLQALGTAGGVQQGQNQAALNAQYNEYLRQLKYTPDLLKQQQALIQGMPGGAQRATYNAEQSDLQKAAGVATSIASLTKSLNAAGITGDSVKSVLKSMGYTDDQINNPYYKAPGTDNPDLYNPVEPAPPVFTPEQPGSPPPDYTMPVGPPPGGYDDNELYAYPQ